MRKILGVSLLLAWLVVAAGMSGAALAQPGAAGDGQQSSIGDSSIEGLAMDGPVRAAIEIPFFFHDDDDDDDDDEDDDGPPFFWDDDDDDDDEDEEDEEGNEDEEEDDTDGNEEGNEDGDAEDDDQADGTDAGNGTDTAPPTTASPAGPASVSIDPIEEPPARFVVSAETGSNRPLFTGESIRIDVRVRNVGLQDGTREVALLVDGEKVEAETLEIGDGEAETKTFEWRFDESGGYDLAVGNTTLGTVTVINASLDARVTPASLESPHSIEVVAATAPADWVRQGHRTTVRTTVVNYADRTAIRTIPVTVNGQPVALETVTLGPYEVRVFSIDFEAAAGAVAVDGVDAGRIDVGRASETVRLPTDEAGTGIDFGVPVLVTVVGTVAGAAGHVVRRRG